MRTVKSLFQLCLLKGSPSNLPYSPQWLGVILTIHILLNLASYPTRSQITLPEFTGVMAASYAILFVVLYAILYFRKMTVRFLKTLLAYLGTELLFLLILFMVMVVVQATMTSAAPLILLASIVWMFAVKAYILKLSLDTQTVIGVLIAINVEILRSVPIMVAYMPTLTQHGVIQ